MDLKEIMVLWIMDTSAGPTNLTPAAHILSHDPALGKRLKSTLIHYLLIFVIKKYWIDWLNPKVTQMNLVKKCCLLLYMESVKVFLLTLVSHNYSRR